MDNTLGARYGRLSTRCPDYLSPAAMNHLVNSSTTDLPDRRSGGQRWLIIALAGWATLLPGLVLAVVWKNPVQRAVLEMAWGLMILWIGAGGLIMWHWRATWDRLAAKVRLPWMLKFVLGCIALALVEEAITTSLTNCAPLLGVRLGQAYITSSANYFDVVLYHSVVVFVPLFIGWAVMLRFWAFHPFAIFLLFGLTGALCETLSFGLQNLGNLGFWIFVYGLMVWLPGRWVPADRGAKPPRWWAYPLAVVLPFAFLPLMFLLAPWLWLTAKHPSIHFPPIGGG
jgi:hypothetical protein